MEDLVMFAFVGLAIWYASNIYRYYTDGKIQATEDYFKQRTVTVYFKTGIIEIDGYKYNVNQVTNVQSSHRKVKISVDDMARPVHEIPITSRGNHEQEFAQRICTAIRKAGGPNL